MSGRYESGEEKKGVSRRHWGGEEKVGVSESNENDDVQLRRERSEDDVNM